MRKTITPCLIQKKDNYFNVTFPEYPDCMLKCEDLDDCLTVAPAYLSAFMLYTDAEFIPHTKPLTPKTENKDQIFTLISCDMDEMENVLSDFNVSPKLFIDWLTGRMEEQQKTPQEEIINNEHNELEQQDEQHNENIEIEEVINNAEETDDNSEHISKQNKQRTDDVSEFDAMFNIPFDDSAPSKVKPEEYTDIDDNEPDEANIHMFGTAGEIEEAHPVINKSEIRQNMGKRKTVTEKLPEPSAINENNNDTPTSEIVPATEHTEEDDNNKDNDSKGLKNKVSEMNEAKKNNSGVFKIIEEEEIEFSHNTSPSSKQNKPSSTSNRQQQNFNKKKHYPPKKKKNYNNNDNNNDNKPS